LERVRMLYSDESGASSVEYGILVAWIAIIIIASVGIYGSAVKGLFANSNAKLPLH
jgi:Flp pilus assembly pilin Flp